jgi:Ca2+-binding RTX toxin-like protein
VTLNGTANADAIKVVGGATGTSVTGLAAQVNVVASEVALDRLVVNAQGGNDTVDASGLPAGRIGLTESGGLGADVLIGSQGDDLIVGGDGDDVALMGAGNDTFVWNPGDDNDTIEGQAGFDAMLFNGANVAEKIAVSANGGRVRFTRDIANVVMDLNDTEGITFNALGGADTVTVNDLSGTDVSQVNLNLAAVGGAGDGAADAVIVNSSSGDDAVQVTGDAAGTTVLGLAARVQITGAEAVNDKLTVNLLAGDDVIEASGLAATPIQLAADGGDVDYGMIGGPVNDDLTGGAGDDVLVGGPGQDVLDGGPGNNIVIQG